MCVSTGAVPCVLRPGLPVAVGHTIEVTEERHTSGDYGGFASHHSFGPFLAQVLCTGYGQWLPPNSFWLVPIPVGAGIFSRKEEGLLEWLSLWMCEFAPEAVTENFGVNGVAYTGWFPCTSGCCMFTHKTALQELPAALTGEVLPAGRLHGKPASW